MEEIHNTNKDQQVSKPMSDTNKAKKVRERALTAKDYKKMDQKEHIYKIPDTYIGSDTKLEREEWIYNFEKKKLVKKVITLPQAIERLYLEIISNAGDNVFASRLSKVEPGNIEVTLTDTTITIRNGGNPIPVEKNEEGMYVPEMIFGTLLSSSNYDTEVIRMGCGRNGYGAKLVNIFSKRFEVKIGDGIRGLRYSQVWSNNMDNKEPPKICKFKGSSFVEVSYELDFKRFEYEKYPPEAFALFGRLALEISLTCKVPVVINGSLYNCEDIQTFASLIFPPTEDDDPVKRSIIYEYSKGETYIEICAMDTPDRAETLSYVNGMITRDGGVHVSSAIKALTKNLMSIFSNKGNAGKDPKLAKANIKITDILPHISLVLNCRIPDPKFTSQTKTKLSAPDLTINIPDKVLLPMKKWLLVERMFQILELKQMNALKETDGKKKRFISGLKGEEANYAGTGKSHQCTLYIVEGKSAMSYAVKAISSIPKGRDFHGILPIKGKLLNVMNATPEQILKNQEIYEIKQALGLKEGLDYTVDENFKTLRYGYLVILTDADDDGKHITGLLINFFYCRFPSLITRGFLFYIQTPIIRVSQGKTTQKFFHLEEYNEWKRQTPNFKSWVHRYYKGLGTSTDKDIKDDFKEPLISMFVYDQMTTDSIRLGFDSNLANQRKYWISHWSKMNAKDDNDPKKKEIASKFDKYCTISRFMNTEFIKYCVSNVHRSIPRLLDGLKSAQRKILWTAFTHWKMSNSWMITKSPKELKVAQFATMAAQTTNYHHGEASLAQAVINMTQDFVGSNNLPYFTQDGQFGCLDPSTPILLWDGSIKEAKDITCADVLVGDDGLPRKIQKVVEGTDEMFEIKQGKGMTYIVNSQHILTLRYTKHKHVYLDSLTNIWHCLYFDCKQNKVISKKSNSFDEITQILSLVNDCPIFDIKLSTYLGLPEEEQKDFYSVYNNVPIEWFGSTVEEPYLYGLSWNQHINIDHKYMVSDKETRFKILCGIIYGCTTPKSRYVNVECHQKEFCFLVQSLGLIYYRLSSTDFKVMVNLPQPTICPHCDKNVLIEENIELKWIIRGKCATHDIVWTKVPTSEKCFPDNCWSSIESSEKIVYSRIKVRSVGKGPYCGWYIDSNERFLLGDFTVTHNTRNLGGTDAASPRYPYTRPQKWLNYVYKSDDFPILDFIEDEGQRCEPVSFLPIIPMGLINGCLGVGSGHSTFIPSCSPVEVSEWLLARISGSKLPDILPWYRNFTGDIVIKMDKVTKDDIQDFSYNSDNEGDEADDPDDLEQDDSIGKKDKSLCMNSVGKYQITSKGSVIINELPIGVWTKKYVGYLEKLRNDKVINSFRNLSTDDKVHFEFTMIGKKPSIRSLKLMRTYGLTNMVLLDENNVPHKFSNFEDLLEEFFQIRLKYYYKRKDYMINDLIKQINTLVMKQKFITLVYTDKITVYKKKKVEIQQQMKEHGIPEELLSQVRLSSLSEEELNDMSENLKNLNKAKTDLESLSPEKMWEKDLLDFLQFYISKFGNDSDESEEGPKRTRNDKLLFDDDDDVQQLKPEELQQS